MTPQRVVPGVALLVLLLALGYTLLPYRFAGVVSCSAPLMGGEAKSTATTIGFIRPGPDCQSAGKSRLTTAAFIAVIAVAAGAGALIISPESEQCRDGSHDDCHGRWPSMMGADSGTCRCSCHG